MSTVSHSTDLTVATLLQRVTRQLTRARLHYGHGTDNARDEAMALIWHALQLDWQAPPSVFQRVLRVPELTTLRALVARRIAQRVPAAYLTGITWFAGLPIQCDARALIPRSPLAELIERQFAPWIDARRVRDVLDLGTGSGCIAIACAHYLPRARVDAADVAPQALALARENLRRHRLTRRVRCVQSNYFAALARRRYDIIVSNPPYVGQRELRALPAEYRHEPELALASGRDGLDAVRMILGEAGAYLRPGGLLVVEVGNSEIAVRRSFRDVPFTWLQFERGGGGVFMLTAGQLVRSAPAIAAALAAARATGKAAGIARHVR